MVTILRCYSWQVSRPRDQTLVSLTWDLKCGHILDGPSILHCGFCKWEKGSEL
jgi:hypothetical protein